MKSLPLEQGSIGMRWYVLRTKPHCEPLVEQRALDLGLRPFLPRMRALVRAGRHRQRRVVPLFPTYLFVEADLERHGKALRYAPGVKDFLRLGDEAQEVPRSIVESVRSRTGDGGVWEPPPRRFAPGERLRIEEGPLRGLEVIFERELSAAGRVAVLLAELELAARVVVRKDSLIAAA